MLLFLAGIFRLKAHYALVICVRLSIWLLLVPLARRHLLVRDVCMCRMAQLADIVDLRIVSILNMSHFLEGQTEHKLYH